MIRIRHIEAAEWVEELEALQRACLPNDKPVDTLDGDWWIAFDQGVPVAFAGLVPSVQYRNTGYMPRAGVLPTHRGMGLQRRLIRVRIARAKRYGWKWLRSDTIDNPTSSNNLIACGFRLFSPVRPWGNPTALYFRRKLAT